MMIFLILEALDSFVYITLQIHILLIKRVSIWMSIMAVYVYQKTHPLYIHPLGRRYTHEPHLETQVIE